MAKAFKTAAVSAARSADDKKAEDVLVLDVRKTSSLVDYIVVATALSRPHLEALEIHIEEALGRDGLLLRRRARPQTDQWRVLDFGGLMVHLMTHPARELYALEKLNDGAKGVSWRK